MEKGDWYLLECFRVAGRLEHVTRAAKELGTSQPALSRAIGRLETRISARVFEPHGRNLALTAKGRALLDVLERKHDEIDDALTQLFLPEPNKLRPIAIGFLRTFEDQIVPEIVGRFRESHPGVKFSFYQKNSTVLEFKLDAGDLDFIFTIIPVRKPTLTWRKVAQQNFVVITSRNHRLASRKSVYINDLKGEPFVCLRNSHPLRKLVDSFCAQAGFLPANVAEFDDLNTIPGFVSVGFGIAIVPTASSWPDKISVLRIRGSCPCREIGVSWKSEKWLHASALAFKNFILEEI